MSSRTISQPTAKTFPVVDLVSAALEGRVRIPEFQRPLRWQWEDVRRLFDSIVKGYPIGNLLLWKRKAPEGPVKLGGLVIQAKSFDEGWWVVDGQQRLTSLANALSEEGARERRFSLAYDLRNQKFVLPDQDDDGYIVPLHVLFDLKRLIHWFTKEHLEASEMLDEASQITRAIREYQIPAYIIDQDDEEVLRDIFTRMNDYGKRLSQADVFSALYPDTRNIEKTFSNFQIAELIHSEQQFGIIDDKTIVKALLARRGPNTAREIRNEFSPERTRDFRDFADESREQFYHEGKLALSRAIQFLQGEAKVPHVAFLPYRYLLVVLTRFFAHFPEPEPRNRTLLRRWFWRAALIGPAAFDSSWNNAERTFATCIKSKEESESAQRLIGLIDSESIYLPKLTDFRPNWAEGRIILTALWALEPRSPITNEPYDLSLLANAIGFDSSPRNVALRVFRYEPLGHRYLASNRILLLEDDIQENISEIIIGNYPSLPRQSLFLSSHALNYALIQKIQERDVIGFLEGRQDRIQDVVTDFLKTMVETDLEDTPPLDSFNLDD